MEEKGLGFRLLVQFAELTGYARTDLVASDLFGEKLRSATDNGQVVDEDAAMELFWDVWDPKVCMISLSADRPHHFVDKEKAPLPDSIEQLFLDKLAEFERATRVEYQPDYEDLGDWDYWERCQLYINVGAARAFALKRRTGYSDDVRDCLERARRAVYQIHHPCSSPCASFPAAPISFVSDWAIAGLLLVELFRVRLLENRYAEALRFLADGIEYYATAVLCAAQPAEEVLHDEDDPAGCQELLSKERAWREKFAGYFRPLEFDAQEAVSAIEQILGSSTSADWKQVTRDCSRLAEHWHLCRRDDDECIVDGNGKHWTWQTFWRYAQGRAEERMSPSDLRDLWNEKEDEAAEARLKAYFFEQGSWEALPKRSIESLIDADRSWFSTRAGRIESTLNSLQIAIESLWHALFWKPLRAWKGGLSLLEFEKRDRELREMGRSPTLADYEWACKRPFFREFVETLQLGENDKQFLLAGLGEPLHRLRALRGSAEHDPARTWRKEDVAPIFKELLGIRSAGVLPRLAKIRADLSPKVKRKGLG